MRTRSNSAAKHAYVARSQRLSGAYFAKTLRYAPDCISLRFIDWILIMIRMHLGYWLNLPLLITLPEFISYVFGWYGAYTAVYTVHSKVRTPGVSLELRLLSNEKGVLLWLTPGVLAPAVLQAYTPGVLTLLCTAVLKIIVCFWCRRIQPYL